MSVKKTAWYFAISILLIVPVFLILTAVHSFLPLLVLLLFWGVQHILFKSRNLTKIQAYPKRKPIGIFLITAIACSIVWFFFNATFFAMGPFYPQDFNGNYKILIPKDSIAYKSGYLITYENKDIKKPSVLVYKTKDGIVWGQELNAPDIFWYEEDGGKPSQLAYEIDITRINKGLVRDTFEFFAVGHGEPGWGYIWRFGGIQKFYIMSF